MTATKNNYDQSSTGHDIELTVMLDGDIARSDFDDAFESIASNGRSTSYLWWTGWGSSDSPGLADCIDWPRVTESDARAWIWDTFRDQSYRKGIELARDIVEERREYYESWLDMLRDYLNGGHPAYWNMPGLDFYMHDGFSSLGLPTRYNAISATGHCQGDYALVLYDPDDFQDGYNPRDMFERMIFDAPVYARVEVDGEEYYIDELMEDNYRWGKREAEKIVRGFDLPDSVKDWIISELPEYPEYVG